MPQRRSADQNPSLDEGNMSVREAGRKGGKTTRARYGAEFFQEIGAKGGRTVAWRATPGTHTRCVVGVIQVRPVRG